MVIPVLRTPPIDCKTNKKTIKKNQRWKCRGNEILKKKRNLNPDSIPGYQAKLLFLFLSIFSLSLLFS
jgi:hypothetical protein